MGKVDMNLGFFPKFAIVIIEILQIFILLRLLILYTENNFMMLTIMAVAFFCLFELGVVKAMGASITIWISGIRYYFSFLPLFLLSYLLALKNCSIKREINWLIVLSLLQIPVTAYQYLNSSKVQLNDRQLLFDMISGTMGGTASNLMSLVVGIGFLYFLIKLVEKRKLIFLLLSLVLLVPSTLAEAKGMMLVVMISLIYLAFIFKFNFSKILVLGVLAALMIMGFAYVYSLLGYDNYGKSLSVSYLIDYANSESGRGRLSRIDSIIHSLVLLSENNALLFGMGIGNANKSPLGHDGQFFDFFTIRHSIDILISETGLVGIAILIVLLWKMVWITRCLLKEQAIIHNESNLLILRLFLGTILIFIFGLFWVDVLFRVQFMYPFGMMAGYALGLHHKLKFDKKAVVVSNYELSPEMVLNRQEVAQ
ncbi:hypothetical protein ACFSKU_10735 [Pontibacter silvestris]|uniref:Uncharacterized protein n=1 Tax=Pontibacter silvestris TaxID=2305183 RepID=A0ABW4WXE1_9BACT|nr:hypothetical protein [Pontibacter silvestris]MCC9138541.1 hypothetical protein [Pontibacter silvestris]